MCLLTLERLEAVNAIAHPESTADETWKGMLKPGATEVLPLEAGDAVSADVDPPALDLPVVPLAPVPHPVAQPASDLRWMEPRGWPFDAGKGKQVIIRLDGYSHTSGVRRAYAQCPYDNHIDCYKYVSIKGWEHTWHAVAWILMYIRSGAECLDKNAHRSIPLPDVEDVESVKDEMPMELLLDVPVELAR